MRKNHNTETEFNKEVFDLHSWADQPEAINLLRSFIRHILGEGFIDLSDLREYLDKIYISMFDNSVFHDMFRDELIEFVKNYPVPINLHNPTPDQVADFAYAVGYALVNRSTEIRKGVKQ